MTEESSRRLTGFIDAIDDGVFCRMKEIEGVIDTSSNLGMVRFRADGSKGINIHVMSFVRSMTPAFHDEVIAAHRRAADKYGFLEEIDEYRTWQFDSSNPLLRMAAESYCKITGDEPEITAVHVGLEPSAFCEKSENLSMINIGADIIDPHTVYERVNVDTIRPFALVITDILEKISVSGKNGTKE